MSTTGDNCCSVHSVFIFYPMDTQLSTHMTKQWEKGSNDIVSMLHHFFNCVLSQEVCELHIFCNSCTEQNKKFTVIRLLHYSAVVLKRFDTVFVTYPVRGHSYMESDKNMGLINPMISC